MTLSSVRPPDPGGARHDRPVRGSASARRWLVLGAVGGVALAAASLVRSGVPRPSPSGVDATPDAVAIVNEQPISRDALARYTDAVARQRGRLELDPAEQRRILGRLIDEELLLQRGIALGLDRSEPNARGAIVTAVVDSLTTAGTREPTREELETFLRENPQGFTRPGRVTIEAALVPLDRPSPAEAPQRAAEIARRARAGEPLAALASALAAPIDPPLPPGPIAIDALRDRVGAPVVQAVAKLAPGETSDPVRAMDGYWIVHLVEREPDVVPRLDDVYEVVKQAWIQREHERQLDEAIAELRRDAHVEILAPELREPRP